MTVTTMGGDRAFKRAVIISAVLHAALFIVMVTSPSLPKPARKGMIHYVSMVPGLPGGGGAGGPGGPGGGGGGPGVRAADDPQPLPPAKKETLRDLTTLQKIQPQESDTALRYPVEKPKRDPKPQEKKAVISKAPPDVKTDRTDAAAAVSAGTGGTGSGLRIGVGDGTGGGGGGGFGPGFGGGGTGFFPHAYYVQIVYDRVSASWFTALVDPGVSGSFSAQVTFRIFRNGRISDLKISESSGLPSLDLSALRAIQTAAPFPPLPNDYDGEYLVFHIIFEHNK